MEILFIGVLIVSLIFNEVHKDIVGGHTAMGPNFMLQAVECIEDFCQLNENGKFNERSPSNFIFSLFAMQMFIEGLSHWCHHMNFFVIIDVNT